jgi:hypothetical protein
MWEAVAALTRCAFGDASSEHPRLRRKRRARPRKDVTTASRGRGTNGAVRNC